MQNIINDVFEFLRANPSILLFGALAAGYALGKVKFGNFSLGSTASVLLVAIILGAVVLGNTEYDLGLIKTVSFGLFIFAIGYRVGPDFVGGLKRGGIKYILVAVFFCVVALISAFILAKAFGLNKGYSGGFLGGALTQSSVIGTADGALQHLMKGKATAEMNLKSDVAIAYAVTYIFGTAGLIILLKLLSGLWRIDLVKSAKEAESELGSVDTAESVEAFHWSKLIMPRAYKLENQKVIGKTVSEAESLFPKRVAIEKIKRQSNIIDDAKKDFKLEKGDIIVLSGFQSRIFQASDILGEEVDDGVLKDMVGEILGICLINKELDGNTLNNIFTSYGHGCYIRSVMRQGHELPLAPHLKVHTGDVINVIGEKSHVDKLADSIGYPERKTTVTDLVTVGIGIIVGTLIGLGAITIGGIPITLGVGGGVLISGLFFGWLRSVKPTWGYIPAATQWIFSDMGLNFFIACVGIAAGPRAITALKQAGISIFLAGACLTCIPHILTWIFGLYFLKLNPVLLLGAMTGSGTCTAAMNSVRTDAKSSIPVIGYTVPYAIGNVLLTIWGAVIVSLI
jgi:putative transport protein